MPHHFQELARGGCHRATLFTEGTGKPEFDPFCEVVLYALADSSWNGRWHLDKESMEDLLVRIDTYSPTEFGELAEDSPRPYWSSAASTASGTSSFGRHARLADGAEGEVPASGARGVGDRTLTLDEILNFIRKEGNHKYIKDLPTCLHGVLGEGMVIFAFDFFDKDRSGAFDKEEWAEFLTTLKDVHLQHLLCTSFQEFRAFFGRGQGKDFGGQGQRNTQVAEGLERTADPEGMVSQSLLELAEDQRMFQIGRDKDCQLWWSLVPRGWLADLYYFSANNHPLHGIICCDPNNLLSRGERVAMEIATIASSLIAVRLHLWWVEWNHAPLVVLHDPFFFSVLVITLPSMVMWRVYFLLFTCPRCGYVNVANASVDQAKRARNWTRAGETVAYILILLCTVSSCMVWRGDLARCVASSGPCHFPALLGHVARGRGRSYIMSWFIMLGLSFNPLIAWGQPNPKGGCSLGDRIGLGRWRIEKQRFRLHYHSGIDQMAARRRDLSDEPTWDSQGVPCTSAPDA